MWELGFRPCLADKARACERPVSKGLPPEAPSSQGERKSVPGRQDSGKYFPAMGNKCLDPAFGCFPWEAAARSDAGLGEHLLDALPFRGPVAGSGTGRMRHRLHRGPDGR